MAEQSNYAAYLASRKKQMQEMRDKGETFETIANSFALSRMRVHQILSK